MRLLHSAHERSRGSAHISIADLHQLCFQPERLHDTITFILPDEDVLLILRASVVLKKF